MGAPKYHSSKTSSVKETTTKKTPPPSDGKDADADRARLLAGHAKKMYEEHFEGSSIADNVGAFPSFDRGQIRVGKVLGVGEVGVVGWI